jgi:hypothetical protein
LVVNGRRPEPKRKETPVASELMAAKIRELKTQGVAPPLILEKLKLDYPDLKIPDILGVN